MTTHDKNIKIELRKNAGSKKGWLIKSIGDTCEIYMVENVDKILPLIDKYLEKDKAA